MFKTGFAYNTSRPQPFTVRRAVTGCVLFKTALCPFLTPLRRSVASPRKAASRSFRRNPFLLPFTGVPWLGAVTQIFDLGPVPIYRGRAPSPKSIGTDFGIASALRPQMRFGSQPSGARLLARRWCVRASNRCAASALGEPVTPREYAGPARDTHEQGAQRVPCERLAAHCLSLLLIIFD